ncbi:hypothetical protein FOA52_007062 [Chlamydomonas sp. UWO 241]|nr:hypothetical protein FOA52_007062 [Chlamydomonas sp. UWO 241]
MRTAWGPSTSSHGSSCSKGSKGVSQRRACVAAAAPDELATSSSPPPSQTSPPPQPVENLYTRLDSLLAATEDPGGGRGWVSAPEAAATEAAALALVQQAVAAGQLKGFGSLEQAVPKKQYTIADLKLNSIQAEALLSPKDNSLNLTRNVAQGAAAAGLAAMAFLSDGNFVQVFQVTTALAFVLVFDQVANQGGGESLIVDTIGRQLLPTYRSRVALHEAGHFLVAYLVGVLPRSYTLSSLDAFVRLRALNVQAGTRFCDEVFVKEVQTGRLSSTSLDRYTNVALAGVVTEYLAFGQAEGGIGDVLQLDGMFRALSFSQTKADSEVRWAVLNAATILRTHEALHRRVAAAMEGGSRVGALIRMIEEDLAAKGV